MTTPTITGSISHGTMRPQDLIPAFLDCIEKVAPAHHEGLMVAAFPLPPSYASEDHDSEWWDSEECADFLQQLFDILDEHAPEGHYFGAHPGDGADYGFWTSEMEEAAE